MDGVLVNTKRNMNLSWQKVQEKFKLNTPFKNYFKYIGIPFEKILRKLFIKNNISKIKKIYNSESLKRSNVVTLYPGVKKTLKKLKKNKIKIGIVTSKDKKRTKKLVKKFQMKRKLIVSPSRELKGKPNPDQLIKAIRLSKVNSSGVIYVGDMLVDYKAAMKAKINYVHANYGYSKKLSYYKHSIRKLEDLLKIIK